MTSHINPIRHLPVFDPHRFGNRRVDVIGCGAVGSKVALGIADLGVTNIHLWDGDIVESHNIANQAFGVSDIGKTKVSALKELILHKTGAVVTEHFGFIESREMFGDIVFLLVDSHKVRKNIFETSLHLNSNTQVVIECRMGVKDLRVYGFNPSARKEVKAWLGSLGDVESLAPRPVSACGSAITVGSTSGITANIAVELFLQHYAVWVEQQAREVPFGLMVNLKPFNLTVIKS